MRSYYQGLRLQFRPTLRRCVSDDFFQYNQGLHVRSCEYLELVVSASAVLADAGVDVCGAGSSCKVVDQMVDSVPTSYVVFAMLGCGQPSMSSLSELPSFSCVFTGIDPGMAWMEASGTVFLRRSK